jgi:peptidoglycan/xylan/chitin deacetylase (PgdA/CDA1 family)
VALGHELGHHGYTHTSPTKLSRDQELEELLKGKAALEQFAAQVTGYRSPSWEVSPNTFDLLVEHGFHYSSSMMDDIKPYVHAGHKIVELPVQWILDDAPYFWFSSGSDWNRTIRSASDVQEIWREEFIGIRALGGLTMLTMHPQFIGRPSRIAMLEQFLTFVKSHDDVWIATAGEVARSVS